MKGTDFSTKGSLSIRLFKYSSIFPLPLSNVERINTTLSILGHLWVSKARGSSLAIHFNTLETLPKLITVWAGERKGGFGVGRCTNCINDNTRKRWPGRCFQVSLLPPQYTQKVLKYIVCVSVLSQIPAKLMCYASHSHYAVVSLRQQASNERLGPHRQPLRKEKEPVNP